MVKDDKMLIKRMSNKDLLRVINKIKYEKAHPEIYGNQETSRYVPERIFWKGYHGILKSELARRKKAGTISKLAGKIRKKTSGTLNLKKIMGGY